MSKKLLKKETLYLPHKGKIISCYRSELPGGVRVRQMKHVSETVQGPLARDLLAPLYAQTKRNHDLLVLKSVSHRSLEY